MASNLERLGGFIQDKAKGAASNFAYGVKASFLSANPAGFAKIGAGIDFLKDEIRSQTQNDKEEAKKQRNEQRRSRGFNEISERNRQYQQMQEQKLFVSIDENIKKILEILLNGQGQEKDKKQEGSLLAGIPGLFDPAVSRSLLSAANNSKKIASAIRSTANAIRSLPRAMTNLTKGISAASRAVARTTRAVPRLTGASQGRIGVRPTTPMIEGPNTRTTRGPTIIDGEFEDVTRRPQGRGGRATGGISQLFDDIAQSVRNSIQSMRASLKGWLTSVKGAFSGLGTKFAKIFPNVAEFANEITTFLKTVLKPVLLMLFRALGPVLSTIFGALTAFDDNFLSEQLGVAKEELGFKERMAGFFGGFIGSILDGFVIIGGYITSWIMGFDYDEVYGDKELVFTEAFTKMFDYFFDAASNGLVYIISLITGNDYVNDVAAANLAYLAGKLIEPTTLFFRSVGDFIANTFDDLLIWWHKEVVAPVKEKIVDLKEWVHDNFYSGISEGLGKIVDNVVDFVYGFLNGAIDFINKKVYEYTDYDLIPDSLKASIRNTLKIGNVGEGRTSFADQAVERNAEYLKELANERAAIGTDTESSISEIKNRQAQRTQETIEAHTQSLKTLAMLQEQSQVGQKEIRAEEERKRNEQLAQQQSAEEEIKLLEEEGQKKNEVGFENVEGATAQQTEQAATIADAQFEQSERQHKEQSDLQIYLNDRLSQMLYGWVGQQSDLFQALVGPLLEGQSGGGPLGTIFDNLFGGGKGGGLGDVLGNLFGKGKGGWFDSASNWLKGTFGPIGESLSGIGDALGGLFKTSSGTSIFSTPGFSGGSLGSIFGGGGASMDPLAALLGTKLSGSLGLTGVGANAAFDVAQSLLTPGTGMAGIKGALAGPGGFAGGLGAIMSVFNGNVDTPGGALSAGLGVYQLLRGGGVGGVLGGGIANLGSRMIASQAAQMYGQQGFAALSQAGMGNAALSGAAKTGFMGKAGSMLGNFGAGMSAGASTGFNIGGQGFGGLGQTGFAANAGAALGAIGNGMMTYAIANMLSGGYEINKSLNKVAGTVGAFFGPVGAAITGVVMGGLNRLFGRKAKEYTDVGLDLNLGADTTGQVYKDWIKKGGVYRSDKKGTEYDDLDNELVQYFNSSAKSIQQGYGRLAEMMGMSADSIVGFTKSYSVSLKGLSAAEQQKKITDAMTQYAKDAIQASYGNVAKYAIEGEDTLATFERLATSTQNVDYWFDALGYTAEKTTDIFKTVGEDMSTAGAEAAAGFLGIDWTKTGYYANFMGGGIPSAAMYGSGGPWTEGMYSMYEGFGGYGGFALTAAAPTAEQQANQQALGIAGAKAAFVEMFGGQEAFGSAMSSYFNLFYSAEEQAEFARRQAVKLAEDVLSGLDPEIASLIEQFGESGVQTQEQFDQALNDYRAQIDAAIAAGDMELAQELISGAELFYQAAELSMQAAEMNEEGDLISQMTPGEFFGHTIQAAQGVMGAMGTEEGIKTLSDTLETTAFTAADAGVLATETAAAVGEAVSSANDGNQFRDLISAAPSINTNQNVTNQNVNLFSDNIRDYHPILDVNIRGVTNAFIGVGSN